MCFSKPVSVILLLALSTTARADGERFALCIGVNSYDCETVQQLKYAESDVADLAALLRRAGYNVVLMTSSTAKIDPTLAPTKVNIEKHLAALAALAQAKGHNDLVLLAFSGRGIQLNGEQSAYFCPADADPNGSGDKKLVSIDEVYRQLDQCGAGKKLFLSDCHWGDKSRSRTGAQDRTPSLIPPKDVLAFSASTQEEKSNEFADLKHGVFFHQILEGMKEKAGITKEDLYLKDLVEYTTVSVASTVSDRLSGGEKQTPRLLGRAPINSATMLLSAADRHMIAEADECEKRKMTRGGLWFAKEVPPTEEARARWRDAAERGSTWGMYMYGLWLECGYPAERDLTKALELYQRAAARGEPNGMISAGLCYINGRGVTADPKRGFDWYLKAANLGDAEGLSYLADCYDRGIGVAQDKRKALESFTAAAELGYSDAMCSLALCHLNDKEKPDTQKAIELFQRAASLGNPVGMCHLGAFYEGGRGVQKDQAKALEWYQKAADLGHKETIALLGCYYCDGIVVKKDEEKAFELFVKAAELGDELAMSRLGSCYLHGCGVKQDAQKAVEWFGKAADLGDKIALNNLASCYRTGFGVAKDLKRACDLNRKAADLGDAMSMVWLGLSYKSGEGVEENAVEAVKWFHKAADFGDCIGMCHLGMCLSAGTGVAKDQPEAVRWFRKAAELGDVVSMYALGSCYLRGDGVAKDLNEAERLFRRAADLGCNEAKIALMSLGKK